MSRPIKGKAFDESVMVDPNGTLANVFVYIKSGLEKDVRARAPGDHGPERLLVSSARTGDPDRAESERHQLRSGDAQHSSHGQVNREWNHSQGPGDPPNARKFVKPEVMIPVKCNIHSWMHAYIGVLDHPYFAVTDAEGLSLSRICRPGTYTVAVWQEKLGTQEQQVTVSVTAHPKSHSLSRRR